MFDALYAWGSAIAGDVPVKFGVTKVAKALPEKDRPVERLLLETSA